MATSIPGTESNAGIRSTDPGPDRPAARGRRSTPGWSSPSASPGSWTASRSPSPARVAAVLTEKTTLGLPPARSACIATVYLLGEVFGALFFGQLSDALGRKNLFIITLGVYLRRQRADRADLGNSARRGRLPLRDPVHRRHGHRR